MLIWEKRYKIEIRKKLISKNLTRLSSCEIELNIKKEERTKRTSKINSNIKRLIFAYHSKIGVF